MQVFLVTQYSTFYFCFFIECFFFPPCFFFCTAVVVPLPDFWLPSTSFLCPVVLHHQFLLPPPHHFIHSQISEISFNLFSIVADLHVHISSKYFPFCVTQNHFVSDYIFHHLLEWPLLLCFQPLLIFIFFSPPLFASKFLRPVLSTIFPSNASSISLLSKPKDNHVRILHLQTDFSLLSHLANISNISWSSSGRPYHQIFTNLHLNY